MKKSVRLPSYIKPERYRLTIKPDLNGFTFEGQETIYLNLEKSVKEITLHAKELEIREVECNGIKSKSIDYNPKDETVTLVFPKSLSKGKGELSLNFKGILNDKMRGFYRSRYIHNGKEKHLATTQFEATDARRAFPCFDEPAQKAIFDITLMVPNGLTAISNTIPASISPYPLPAPTLRSGQGGEGGLQEHESGYQVVNFQPTPKMSTYLVAFIIGEMEFIEGRTKPRKDAESNAEGRGKKSDQGTLVRVFVTPGKKHQAQFALDTSIKMLEFYNDYFDIDYPLPVLDLIAIPDFSHGAMENWGAVTYRESALLVDSKLSSAANKQWVALVIAHELAHQWFGNLVTMEWWTHLWLNEGFASYIEYLAVDHLFPKWEIWTQFAAHDLNPALELDSLKHTHPIEVEVNHPDEIGEIFDEISYSKGSSVIRMLAAFLGERDFRDGLRYYLKKHSYENASTVQLWEAFEKISKKPVRKLMQNWTGMGGYPSIRVVEGHNSLTLTQSRFFSSPLSKNEVKDKPTWHVPISVTGYGLRVTSYLMEEKSITIKKPEGKWVKINVGETGFFRTDYPAQMLAALQNPIKSKKISAVDRLGIIRDSFALAEAGELPTLEAIKLISAYKNETDYTVWLNLALGLAELRNLFYEEKYYPEFAKYCRQVLNEIGQKLGFKAKKGEGHTEALLRSLILHQLTSFDDEKVIEEGKKIAKNGINEVSADIKSVIYQIIAQTGSSKTHADFINRYKLENLSEEKNRIGRALGQFRDKSLLKKSLAFALSEDVRIQDTAGIFMAVWNNPMGRKTAWEFTKENWQELLKRYPSSGHMLNRFIKPVANFVTKQDANEAQEFFKKHTAPGAERTVQQVLEKIYSNDLWLKRDGQPIESWLKFRN